jgi:hypothetical protein
MITFTEDDVVAAYRRHPEWKPGFRKFQGKRRDGERGCCPMAILCLDPDVPDSGCDADQFLSPSQVLGFTEREMTAFAGGVDRCSPPIYPELIPAFRLGRRVLRRLADEGMLSPKLAQRVLALQEEEN